MCSVASSAGRFELELADTDNLVSGILAHNAMHRVVLDLKGERN